MPIVLKTEHLNLLETTETVEVCRGIALPIIIIITVIVDNDFVVAFVVVVVVVAVVVCCLLLLLLLLDIRVSMSVTGGYKSQSL
jgi:hypothetical protein